MPDDFVTKTEFTKCITDLERKMDNGFNDIGKKLTEILGQIEIGKLTDKEHYDERYVLKADATQESINRVNDAKFQQACFPIVSNYLNTENGKRQISCLIDAHYGEKRDSATKWINFVKLIGGIVIAIMALYGGNTVIKSNNQTQRALIETMQNTGE